MEKIERLYEGRAGRGYAADVPAPLMDKMMKRLVAHDEA